jgi:hypothetical protein
MGCVASGGADNGALTDQDARRCRISICCRSFGSRCKDREWIRRRSRLTMSSVERVVRRRSNEPWVPSGAWCADASC